MIPNFSLLNQFWIGNYDGIVLVYWFGNKFPVFVQSRTLADALWKQKKATNFFYKNNL
jgi:hypothetical protein